MGIFSPPFLNSVKYSKPFFPNGTSAPFFYPKNQIKKNPSILGAKQAARKKKRKAFFSGINKTPNVFQVFFLILKKIFCLAPQKIGFSSPTLCFSPLLYHNQNDSGFSPQNQKLAALHNQNPIIKKRGRKRLWDKKRKNLLNPPPFCWPPLKHPLFFFFWSKKFSKKRKKVVARKFLKKACNLSYNQGGALFGFRSANEVKETPFCPQKRKKGSQLPPPF